MDQEPVRVIDDIDVDTEKRRLVKNNSIKAARILHAISLGWDTYDGIRKAVMNAEWRPTRKAIKDHCDRLQQKGLIVCGLTEEEIFDDIPEPGSVLDMVDP